jgi:hypothetical protein
MNLNNILKCSLVVFLLLLSSSQSQAEIKELKYESFSFEQELTLPGSPDEIYDAISGDISGWWDHSFSEHPYKFYIEAKPGGGFYEIFNEAGDGVKHATVIVADRGRMLRFDGPLGLSGMAIQVVSTYTFKTADNDSTQLKLSVHASGEINDGLPEIVENVWHHFMFDRFKPYIEQGKHLKQ